MMKGKGNIQNTPRTNIEEGDRADKTARRGHDGKWSDGGRGE